MLTGVYKEKESDADTKYGPQPNYIYFNRNGTLVMATPEIGGSDEGYYGSAYRGTWKAMGNNCFILNVHSVYNKDHYKLELNKDGSHIFFETTAKHPHMNGTLTITPRLT